MSSYKGLLGFALLGLAVVALGLGALSALPENATTPSIALFVPIIVIAPLVVLGAAMARRSKGYVFGTIAALPFLLAATQAVLWLQVFKIAAFNDRDMRAPQQPHDTVLIQNRNHGLTLGDDACDDVCRQILLATSYDVVLETGDGRGWMRFALGRGTECMRPTAVRQYAYMLGRRYLDVCAVRSETPRLDDALVVVETFVTNLGMPQRQPLHSTALELFERNGGKDTPLGRWAAVTGMQGILFDPLGISGKGDLAPFSRWEFYGRVLGRTLEEYLPVGAAATEDILTALGPVFDDPDAVQSAMSAFDTLARSGRDKDLLWAFVAGRAGELKASPSPDPEQIEWCESWLDQLS